MRGFPPAVRRVFLHYRIMTDGVTCLVMKEQRYVDAWICLFPPSAKNALKLEDVKMITLIEH